ncbi:MAG: TRAP transporter large permease [Oscillospiraceae bacterium]|nr:TRAP transporter large permease [Oscillospiraceae bacterium]
MIGLLLFLMFLFLLLNFPMKVAMIVAPMVIMIIYFPEMPLMMSIQQLIAGISSVVLLSVPMFIFAADIMCTGKTTTRLLDLVESFVGHVRGGMAITAAATCVLFSTVSGSTQATFVAVGKPMRTRLVDLGYKDSSAIGLLMYSAIVALVIPPSISMIMYAVVTGTSVGQLFIAGVGPGLLMFFAIAVYCYFFARKTQIPLLPKGTWARRSQAFLKALPSMGFPVVIFAGIYSGTFSPVEAAAISVLYALILEMLIFRSVNLKALYKIAVSTAVVTCVVFVLVAAGQLFSWVISFARIPQMLIAATLGSDPTALAVLIMVTIFFFVGCIFVDSLVVIIILGPIFYPVAMGAGVDPIHLGIVVVLQAAIGAVSPPLGANIFTACAIFNRPLLTVLRGTPPYLIIMIIISAIVILIPELSLFLLDR